MVNLVLFHKVHPVDVSLHIGLVRPWVPAERASVNFFPTPRDTKHYKLLIIVPEATGCKNKKENWFSPSYLIGVYIF